MQRFITFIVGGIVGFLIAKNHRVSLCKFEFFFSSTKNDFYSKQKWPMSSALEWAWCLACSCADDVSPD